MTLCVPLMLREATLFPFFYYLALVQLEDGSMSLKTIGFTIESVKPFSLLGLHECLDIVCQVALSFIGLDVLFTTVPSCPRCLHPSCNHGNRHATVLEKHHYACTKRKREIFSLSAMVGANKPVSMLFNVIGFAALSELKWNVVALQRLCIL